MASIPCTFQLSTAVVSRSSGSTTGRAPADERLVSWSAPDDPSPGSFAYGVDTHTALQLYLWNGTRPLMRDGPWTGYSVASRYQANASVFVYQAVVSTIYLTYTLSYGAARTRFVLTAAGQYQLQSWSAGSSAWAVIGSWPTWECNRYGHCGPYGYCDNTMAAPTCRSAAGQYQLQSWSAGSSAWAVIGSWPTWECNRYGHCGPYGYCDNTMAAPTCRCLDGFEPADGDGDRA